MIFNKDAGKAYGYVKLEMIPGWSIIMSNQNNYMLVFHLYESLTPTP